MASSLTKRYGKAILDIAKEKNNTNIWIDNFSNSKEIMNDDDLYSFLSSPQVPNSEKYKSIDTLFKGYEKLFINFLKLLINKGHINYFERVMNEFFDQNQISEGKVSAIVTSFVKLTVAQKDEITKKICDVFKVDDVEISENLDKSILGGYIIKVGDTIIDCSTKNKLNGLENHLLRSTTL
ncbi:MAG: ATP synthase F1 subunit delta [SAR202 cluster bacterium]|nr:ATP synthase F1 subunit delta [Chloroflexota bacterium]MQF85365.1 ATP synthase F1 subunit delta [SAR202 cluster bacterium]MQF92922.1 ATP synthase F1 subunit delta [SAR202 cluster bacterium]|tara:strand:- start:11624 stop:12166 length:543 start_codon:yes stop_codon:yes gene_type:complete